MSATLNPTKGARLRPSLYDVTYLSHMPIAARMRQSLIFDKVSPIVKIKARQIKALTGVRTCIGQGLSRFDPARGTPALNEGRVSAR